MEVKAKLDRCRLCFSQTEEYINIFVNSASTQNIVDTLRHYFYDEIRESDSLPKVICIECWIKIDAFRKFSEEVIALQDKYLQQHHNNTVKHENIEEDSNVQSESHEEIIFVDPLRSIETEEDDANIELNKTKYESDNEQEINNDDESLDIMELPENGEGVRLSQLINVITPEQKQQIIDQNVDMTCDFCVTKFQSFEEAQRHYELKHNNQSAGYVKCCGLKLTQPEIFNSHIVWHLNAFKCEICGVTKRTLQSYQRHKNSHSRHRILLRKCDLCNERFKTKKRLDDHFKIMHPNDSYVDLDDYLEEIRSMVHEKQSNAQIKSIMDKYFDRKCWQCDTEFDTLKMAKIHYSSSHRNPNGFLSCCNLKLKTNVAVFDHIQWHIDPHTFRCRVCNRVEPKHRYPLVEHVKKHKTKR